MSALLPVSSNLSSNISLKPIDQLARELGSQGE